MSSIHGTIHRYQIILEKLSRNFYPSIGEIKDSLHNAGFENSQRTIQRDFENLRYEFGVSIVYHRSKRGYFIDESSHPNVEQFLRFAHLSEITRLMVIPESKKEELNKYISFESQGNLKGLHLLRPLFMAIRNRQQLILKHTTFYRNESKHFQVLPYLLKEYNERWYLVAWAVNENEFRSFGIERIDHIQSTDETFDRSDHPDPASFFEETIGIMFSHDEAQQVELSFEPFQGKYIKTLPLHPSQEILADDDNELRIKLRVVINIELKRKILSYGSKVKVLTPNALAEDIASELTRSVQRYT